MMSAVVASKWMKEWRECLDPVSRECCNEGRDRRQFERVLVDLEVDYSCEDMFLFAYITDISAMGIFVQTRNPEKPGMRLNLCFTIPNGQHMEFEGEVIWINPY